MKTWHSIEILIGLLIGYLLYLIMKPFFVPIFWGAVFAVLFYPHYKRLLKYFKRPSVAAFVACSCVALFLIAPLTGMGAAITVEVLDLYNWAEMYLKESAQSAWDPFSILPLSVRQLISRYADLSAVDLRSLSVSVVKEAGNYFAKGVGIAVKSFAEFFLTLALSFLTMFFLFRDGEKVLSILKKSLPVPEEEIEKVLARNRLVISATFTGGVLVGAVQGIVGAIGFWAVGLGSPVLWGFMMFMFSFLPTVGTALIWGPGVIYLLIAGYYVKAIVLLIWGVFIIGLADNILRPVIVSGRTSQHPLLLFFCILGAVNVFGLIGIIAGPIILSAAQCVFEIYMERIKAKDTEAGGPAGP